MLECGSVPISGQWSISGNDCYDPSETLVGCIKSGKDYEWETATCIQKDCSPSPSVSNGDLCYADLLCGTEATVNCDPGYIANPATITCQSNGMFDAATCDIDPSKVCSLPSVTNGEVVVSNIDLILHDDIAVVLCDEGYTPTPAFLTCVAGQAFTQPSCDLIDCGTTYPAAPSDGSFSSTSTTVGSLAELKCDTGFVPTDSNVHIVCGTDGAWTTTHTTCEFDCGYPAGLDSNGHFQLDVTDETTIDATATLECCTGYTTSSSVVITCQSSGWSAPSEQCQLKDCGTTFNAPLNGIITPLSTNVGSLAVLTCNADFAPSDPDDVHVVCGMDGTWTTTATTCEYIRYVSCADVLNRNNEATDGVYTLVNAALETFCVYCDFSPSHIYTYIAPTSLETIDIDVLFNNRCEFKVRHQTLTWEQKEVTIKQISKYANRDISIQYNSNDGYNNIQNTGMGPYVYIAMLPIAGIDHDGDTQGYSISGSDHTFLNCDGNPNSYFVLLFNKDDNTETRTGSNTDNTEDVMKKWRTEAVTVTTEREFPNKFFSSYEIHFGGCGGFIATPFLRPGVKGMSLGIRYDIPYRSCYDVHNKVPNPPNGVYRLDNGCGQLYYVYCEFFTSHIYTYIAPTSLETIDIDVLFNNEREFKVRHQTDTLEQKEVTIKQTSKYANRDISIQYNSNDGYNNIQNTGMGPYVYVAMLPIAGIDHNGDTQGYSISGSDHPFLNCGGNPNSYFVLLFNKDDNTETRTGSNTDNTEDVMKKWRTEAVTVTTEREFPNKFFSSYEIHFGGCGGFIATPFLRPGVKGMSLGIRYVY